MALNAGDRNLVLRGLFVLTITCADEDETRRQVQDLAARLGGDPDAMFYGAALPKQQW